MRAGRAVLLRLARDGSQSWSHVQAALQPQATIQDPLEWTDVGGLLMSVERLRNVENEIARPPGRGAPPSPHAGHLTRQHYSPSRPFA